MSVAHTLGFPRLGAKRELKHALERYWRGETDRQSLYAEGRRLRQRHWQLQIEAGLDLVSVGDFSWYDHVLDTSAMIGAVPPRFGHTPGQPVDLDTYFRMARGRAPSGGDVAACEMTKWFDTNYHYIVPELGDGQEFHLARHDLFEQTEEALALGMRPKPVLLGPVTYLWLAKTATPGVDRLSLLDGLLPVYAEVLRRLQGLGVQWVQVDEPALSVDLDEPWRRAFASAYDALSQERPRLLLATYFGDLGDNLSLAAALEVDGLHVDMVRGGNELDDVAGVLPHDKVLSLGVVDGRNVWRTDLQSALARLERVAARREISPWVAPSCSLLHAPLDLALEHDLPVWLRDWLAFGVQKLDEVVVLRRGLSEGREAIQTALDACEEALAERARSTHIHRPEVHSRVAAITPAMSRRSRGYAERAPRQREALDLPVLPTTTIGSFPQTQAIRRARRDHRAGRLSRQAYESRMREEIAANISRQEEIGLDVLVHGEPERNDMVEYFGEMLAGFAFTRHGWVQSFGSRGVKPPIIFGDVMRPEPMTVDWLRHAQSLTDKPVKGMLTGPVTILQWSFVRDDQPREETCRQIALALRDEVADLQKAGLRIIQIDEPALREGLPLRREKWQHYLDWATECFRLAAGVADDATQIHTHMCYAEFHDILPAIAALDADVITIEAARSHMALLQAFADFEYPNEVGPGIYDIHSPNVPTTDAMVDRLSRAAAYLPPERLWVNPDCGLKTRSWEETTEALRNMVAAASRMRGEVAIG